jgi:cyclic pyranopterin phosphate synthase
MYCMPVQGISLLRHEDVLRYEEIVRVARIAEGLGFCKFRLTGGEPLVRKGIVSLVETLAHHCPPHNHTENNNLPWHSVSSRGKSRSLAMTTNGVLLAEYARPLRAAGLDRINVSLDTLDRTKYRRITGFDSFDRVMAGIREARSAGFEPLKINVVAMRGINDDEVGDFVRLTKQGFEVRFIELMPFRVRAEGWSDLYISGAEIREDIAKRFRIQRMVEGTKSGPAKMYRAEDWPGRIGFIEPISSRFCSACNRLRLTSDGFLKPCLLSDVEVDLKTPLRTGATDEEIAGLFGQTILEKPEGHRLREHRIPVRAMAQVGG